MEPLLDGNATRDAQAEELGLFDENLNLKLLSIKKKCLESVK